MRDFSEIPEDIKEKVLSAKSVAIWPISESPMSASYQIARFFDDSGWYIFPIHAHEEKLLDYPCYRDIRLIPEDYDILLLFMDVDQLPVVVNDIFNADFTPPIVWAHEGIVDLETMDRLIEGGIPVIMDCDLRDFYTWATDRE